MATDSVMGLFTSPQQYQQDLQTEALGQGMKLAQLSPVERAAAMGYAGGAGIGRGISGLMGAEDPQMKLAATRQQVLQGLDRTDPNSLMKGVRQLMEMGDVRGANDLQSLAQETALKQSQVTRNLRERPANEPEIVRLQNSRTELATQFGEADPRVKQIDAAIAKMTRQGKTLEETMGAGLGAIASAMAGAQAKKAAEASGTEVGKKVADIEGSQTALSAIKGAKDIFNKGIYAGKYGPTMEGLAGYTGGTVGSTERLANTETFRSYLGDVVIPGLKDFGGSDTVEELKYLQGVYAGDTTAQPKALKNMLERAETKITSKINRIQSQQKAIEKGQPLPTGPSDTGTPKATRRFNLQTGKFETITQ